MYRLEIQTIILIPVKTEIYQKEEKVYATNKNNSTFFKRTMVNQKRIWKVCIQDPFDNCEKIYPIQQKKVQQMISNLKDDTNVEKIIVFGSSVQDTCHMGSDEAYLNYIGYHLQQAVELNLLSKK